MRVLRVKLVEETVVMRIGHESKEVLRQGPPTTPGHVCTGTTRKKICR